MVRAEHILVVEDEPDILAVIRYNLEREGYRVSTADDGATGLELAKREHPDLLLLDLMLPKLSGLEICRRIKGDEETKSTLVIMVTAKGEENDVIAGLEAGADDYVTKPFSPRILVARVKSVLRRRPGGDSDEAGTRISFPGLTIDVERHEVTVDESTVKMTATEFRLLQFLAQHPGRVFTRGQLLDRVFGVNVALTERNIDVHIGAIRRKLKSHRERIETLRGVGYRFRDN